MKTSWQKYTIIKTQIMDNKTQHGQLKPKQQ